LRWETGAVLPSNIQNDTLSSRENEYFSDYNKVLSNYIGSIGLELTSDLEVCID
jgi:hypothetical protein